MQQREVDEADAELISFNASFCAQVLSGAVAEYTYESDDEVRCFDHSEDEEVDYDGDTSPCSEKSTAAETADAQFAQVNSWSEEAGDDDDLDIGSYTSSDGSSKESASIPFRRSQDEQSRLEARTMLLKACFEGCVESIDDYYHPYTVDAIDDVAEDSDVTEDSDGEDAEEDTELQGDDGNVQLRACEALMKACNNGVPAETFGFRVEPGEELKVDMERLMAADSLLKAVSDGANTVESNEKEQMRLQARRTLLQGVKDGSLAAALKDTMADTQAKDEEAKEEETSLRQHVRELLFQSAKDGRLSSALQEVLQKRELENEPAEKQDNFRFMVQRSLVEACHDGRLNSALKEVKTESLRREERTALINASRDGRLAQVLATVKIEDLRKQAKNAIVNASRSGQLTTALQEASAKRAQEDVVEGMRLMAKEVMLNACRDGRLAEALRSVEQKPQLHVQNEEDEELSVEALVSDLEAAMDTSAAHTAETVASPFASRSKHLMIGGITRAPSNPDLQAATNAGGAAAGRGFNAVRVARLSKASPPSSFEVDFKDLTTLPVDFQTLGSYKPSIAAAPSNSNASQKVSAARLDLCSSSASQHALRPVTPSSTLLKSASSGTISLKVTKAPPLGLRSTGASIAGLDSSKITVSPLSMHGSAAWGSRMGRKSVSMASLAAPIF